MGRGKLYRAWRYSSGIRLDSRSLLMNAVTKSWQTTLAGLFVALPILFTQLAFLWDGDTITNPDWTIVFGAVAAMFGFAVARDNGVRSERAGAK